jgi:hypothetical protein
LAVSRRRWCVLAYQKTTITSLWEIIDGIMRLLCLGYRNWQRQS